LGLHGPVSGYLKVDVVEHTRRHGRASAWWRVVGCDKNVHWMDFFLDKIWIAVSGNLGNSFDLSFLRSNCDVHLPRAFERVCLRKGSCTRPADDHYNHISSCLNFSVNTPAIMSDYEDEMDVDAPAAQSSIQFSSNSNEKGKRSAANLPVELQDTLPWHVSHCYHSISNLTMSQGGEVPTKHSRRRLRPPGYSSNDQQVRRQQQTTPSPPLRPSWYRQNLDRPRSCSPHLRKQEYAPDGSRTERL